MLQWHETVSQKLMLEAQASKARSGHQRELSDGLSDVSTIESSRDSYSRDSSTTADDRSLVDAAAYFSEPRPRPQFRPPEPLRMQAPPSRREHPPWSPERRRSSSDPNLHRAATWSTRDNLGRHGTITRNTPLSRSRHRSPSTVSTSSSSSSSSSTTTSSGESHSPRHRHSESTATLQPPRRSASFQVPNGQPAPRQNPSQSGPPMLNPPSSFAHRHPPAPANANTNARGHNVRWGNDSVYNISPGRNAAGKSRAKSEERPRRQDDKEVRGVGGRTYVDGGRR